MKVCDVTQGECIESTENGARKEEGHRQALLPHMETTLQNSAQGSLSRHCPMFWQEGRAAFHILHLDGLDMC